MINKLNYSVIVNAVVVKNDKILLAKRSLKEKHVPGKWSPPGGKLEETNTIWEALQKTAKREVLEETNIEVKDEMYLLANNTFRHEEDNLSVIAITFLCFYKKGKAKPLEDTIEVKWVSEDEIGNYDFTHPRVKEYVFRAFDSLKRGAK